MAVIKRRADIQAQYRQQTTVGVIHSVNRDSPTGSDKVTSYDVKLLGVDNTILRKVPNSTVNQYKAGEGVTLVRVARFDWAIVSPSHVRIDSPEGTEYARMDSGHKMDSGYIMR